MVFVTGYWLLVAGRYFSVRHGVLFFFILCLFSLISSLFSLVSCLLSFVSCLLSIAYCLLPIVFCLLSFVFCPLPIACYDEIPVLFSRMILPLHILQHIFLIKEDILKVTINIHLRLVSIMF